MPATTNKTAYFSLPTAGISTEHTSVLVQESIRALDLHDGQLVVDATAGQGGHSEAIMEAANVRLIAMDADAAAVAASRTRLQTFGDRVQVVEGNFRDLKNILESCVQEISKLPSTGAVNSSLGVDRVFFDLGWNRGQLSAGKGFSFQGDEPLLMTYGVEPASGFTAHDILNTWSEEAIGNVLFGYGGERYARRIAKRVVEARRKSPLVTTSQFVVLIEQSVPAFYRRGRTHFATKSFQGLRIAVNDELGSIEKGLRAAWDMLSAGGRIAVITFHSLEDKLVKKIFVEFSGTGGELVQKKPITPAREEIVANRAARSAKLRVILKH